MKKIQQTIDELTEVSNSYILCNHYLMDCYNSLSPYTLSRLSFAIFSRIISNRKYYKKSSKVENGKDKRRIYNNLSIDGKFLLHQCSPEKYNVENKDSSKDIGNLYKRINSLADNNIFYVWKYGSPSHYVFFMERNFAAWRVYNSKAYIPPKSILKILQNAEHAIDDTWVNVQLKGLNMSRKELENSFELFLKDIFSKTRHELYTKLISCNDRNGVYNYISECLVTIENEDFDQYVMDVDEDFLKRLPVTVADRVEELINESQNQKKQKTNVKKESASDMNDIIDLIKPKDGNLVKKKFASRKKPIAGESIAPDFDRFERKNPFETPADFFNFYRCYIRSIKSESQFYTITHQRNYAAEILDTIKDDGRDNKKFVVNWINFYISKNLGGGRIKDKEKTSLKSFKESYAEYSERSFS